MSSSHGTTTKCLVTGEPCPPGVDDENYLENCCWFLYDCRMCMYELINCRRYPEKAIAMIEEAERREELMRKNPRLDLDPPCG
jgi:hypothetical protein